MCVSERERQTDRQTERETVEVREGVLCACNDRASDSDGVFNTVGF